MYAIVRSGGRQYRVAPNDVIVVDKVEAEPGGSIVLNEVLMLGDGHNVTAGAPLVEGAVVRAEVLEQRKGQTILVFKKKRRQNYQRTRGHRQKETVLRVTEIINKNSLSSDKKTKPSTKEQVSSKDDTKPKAKE